KGKESTQDLFARCIFDLINTDRLSDIKTTGPCAPQRFQVRAAAEFLANVMYIRANIKTFAAKEAEIDFWQRDSIHIVTINMNKARLALDPFSLARYLLDRHAPCSFPRPIGGHVRKTT